MEEFDFHPEKPELIEKKRENSLSLTVFSIVIFIFTFMLLLGDEINLIIYLVVVLLFHELGHFLMMKFFHYKEVRMLFVPLMGAFVQGSKDSYSQKQSFIIAIAGPLPGVLVGAVLMWYGNYVHSFWIVEVSALFLLLNIVNLVPLAPLDGGQLFKLFVRNGSELFLMVFALVSSLLVIGLGFLIDSMIVMLFGFFMGFRVRALQKSFQMHKDIRNQGVDYATTYKLLSNGDYRKIKNILLQHSPQLQKYIDLASSEESDPILASQVNNVLSTPIVYDASVFFKLSIFLLWILAFITPIILYYTLDMNWILSVLKFQMI